MIEFMIAIILFPLIFGVMWEFLRWLDIRLSSPPHAPHIWEQVNKK